LKAEKAITYIRQNKKPYSYSSRDSYRPQYNRLQQGDRYNRRCNEQYDERRNYNSRSNKHFITDDKDKSKERDLKDKPRVYIINSNNEAFVALSRLSSSIRFANINGIYIVRDILDFYSNHYKLRCNKNFRSIKAKTVYKDNKTYVKIAKLEARKKMFIFTKRIYHIYEVLFKSYNKLFRHFKNRYIGTTLSIISPEILSSEISSELSSLDLIYRMLDIFLLTPPIVPVFEQEHIV